MCIFVFALSVSAAGACQRGRVPLVLKAFPVSAAACCAVCLESIRKKSKSAGLTGKKVAKKQQQQKNTQEFSSGKCFFITVLDECHRLQVRC